MNKDIAAYSGEPLVERWVRITASVDIPVFVDRYSIATETAETGLRIVVS